MRSIGSFRRLVFHELATTNTTEIGTAMLPLRRVTLPALTDVLPSAQRHTAPAGPASHPPTLTTPPDPDGPPTRAFRHRTVARDVAGKTGQPHRRAATYAAKRGGVRFRRLAVALLVAIAASALPTPALAQMTPAHCNPSDPLELWCATLTVGFDPIAVSIYGYFDPANYSGGSGRKGSLSRLQFTYKGVTYTVDDLSFDKNSRTEDRGSFFGLSGLGEMVFANDARFTLRLGPTDISLGDSQWEFDGMSMPRADLSWANGDTVQVTLTRSNAPPTAADNTLTTNEDTQYTFDADDFNFSDTADRDDTLVSVKITALPTAGALSVDGTAILSGNLPKTVSKSDIDAGNLTYTPPPEFNGAATFRFKVNDGYVDSASDDLMTITIPAATTVPGAPRSLSATASGTNRINLSWSAPASDGGSAITGYRIEVSLDGGSNWTDRVANTNGASTTYAHTGLAVGDTRHYRVSAINTIGTGTPSNVDDATTGTTTTTVPGAPPGSRQRPAGPPGSTSPGARRPATAAPPSPATGSRSRPMASPTGPTASPTRTAPPPPTRTPGLPPAPRATTASPPSTPTAPPPPPTPPTPPLTPVTTPKRRRARRSRSRPPRATERSSWSGRNRPTTAARASPTTSTGTRRGTGCPETRRGDPPGGSSSGRSPL